MRARDKEKGRVRKKGGRVGEVRNSQAAYKTRILYLQDSTPQGGVEGLRAAFAILIILNQRIIKVDDYPYF